MTRTATSPAKPHSSTPSDHNILIFGQTGQVANALKTSKPEARFLSRAEADLSAPQICAEAIHAQKPDFVINAAAYTAVDKAEEEEDLAHIINAQAPEAMAKACKTLNIPFIHISTDYVFDGSGSRPWRATDPVAPLGAYGRTKLAGEQAILAAGGTHAILRTAWVFSETGNNFVKTMLRLGATRDELTIVGDQIGGPTPASAIAQATLTVGQKLMQGKGRSGIYHFTGSPHVSWADFAREIFAQSGLVCEVKDIPSSAYPTPAKRPYNSRLECIDIKREFSISEPDWKAELTRILTLLEGSHAT